MVNEELLADAAIEIVTLGEARLQTRVDNTADDSLIAALITSARQYCEKYCNRAFINQTWMASFDYDDLIGFKYYYLPFGKIQEIETVFFYDDENTPILIDADNYRASGNRFLFNSNYVLPTGNGNYRTLQTMQIVWKVGFGDAVEDVPQALKQAVLLMIGHWYENRAAIYEAVGGKSDLEALPLGVKAILDSYRIYE